MSKRSVLKNCIKYKYCLVNCNFIVKIIKLTHAQHINAIKKPSKIPALPTTHDIRIKNITPKMFCMP